MIDYKQTPVQNSTDPYPAGDLAYLVRPSVVGDYFSTFSSCLLISPFCLMFDIAIRFFITLIFIIALDHDDHGITALLQEHKKKQDSPALNLLQQITSRFNYSCRSTYPSSASYLFRVTATELQATSESLWPTTDHHQHHQHPGINISSAQPCVCLRVAIIAVRHSFHSTC